MPYTRFGLEGYGVRRAGSFAGKTVGSSGGPHPVGKITRFGLEGYGVRRAGSFAGKTTDTGGGITVTRTFLMTPGYSSGGSQRHRRWGV